uniref:pentapeptide repeat-containing protein n=1 Tax=Candidatus Phytoplasma sp. AldY-WA1 TaxID=2852100 RepID=UPI003014ABA0
SGYTLKELKEAGFDLDQFKDAGYKVIELKDAGFTLKELKDAGFNLKELKEVGFYLDQLKDAGYKAIELKDAGFNLKELKDAGFNLKELKEVGFDLDQLKDAGYKAIELKDAGFTLKELKTNEEKTIYDFITDAIEEIDTICETYKEKYNTLKIKIAAINTKINKQTANLDKTIYEEKLINDFIEDNKKLIEIAEQNLKNEQTIAEYLKKDVKSLTEEKKQELLTKSIDAIFEKNLKQRDEINQKKADLANQKDNIERIEKYIKSLKEINDNYETEMKKNLGSEETKNLILKINQEQVARYEEELKETKASQTELEDKINFYTFLIVSLDEAK